MPPIGLRTIPEAQSFAPNCCNTCTRTTRNMTYCVCIHSAVARQTRTENILKTIIKMVVTSLYYSFIQKISLVVRYRLPTFHACYFDALSYHTRWFTSRNDTEYLQLFVQHQPLRKDMRRSSPPNVPLTQDRNTKRGTRHEMSFIFRPIGAISVVK